MSKKKEPPKPPVDRSTAFKSRALIALVEQVSNYDPSPVTYVHVGVSPEVIDYWEELGYLMPLVKGERRALTPNGKDEALRLRNLPITHPESPYYAAVAVTFKDATN